MSIADTISVRQTWVNYEFPFRNLFPSTPFKLLPNFRRTNMHTESLAVIQKQWREKNSESEFVIDPSLADIWLSWSWRAYTEFTETLFQNFHATMPVKHIVRLIFWLILVFESVKTFFSFKALEPIFCCF